MSDQSWYIRGDGNQPAGPFTAQELAESLRAHRLDASTLCWREGMPQWVPLSQVGPFAATVRARTQPAAAGARRPPALPGRTVPRRAHTRSLLRRHAPIIGACVGAGAVLLTIIVVAVLMRRDEARNGGAPGSGGGPSTTNGNESSAEAPSGLSKLILDYAGRLRVAHARQKTDVQRQEAVAAAERRLEAEVSESGTITLTGMVADITQAASFGGARSDTWEIGMDVPDELTDLAKKGICSVRTTLFVELEKKDALTIRKGDPISLRGAVSYRTGGPFFMVKGSFAVITVHSPKGSQLFGDYQDRQFTLLVGENALCSVGRLESIRVLGQGGK